MATTATAPTRAATGPVVVAVVTAVVLIGTQLVLHLAPRVGTRLMNASSTDWPTLRRDPVLPWVTSAFWVSEGVEATVFWVVVLPASLGLLAWRLRPARALLIAGAAHVLASLGSEGLLAMRYAAGDLTRADLHLLDVGPSYVAVATVAALVVVQHGWARAVAVVALAVLLFAPPIGLLDGLTTLAVSPVGHVLSVIFGSAGAVLARRPRISGRRAGPGATARPGRSR